MMQYSSGENIRTERGWYNIYDDNSRREISGDDEFTW